MDRRRLLRDITGVCLILLVALEFGAPSPADGELPSDGAGIVEIDDVVMDTGIRDVSHPGCRFVIDLSGYEGGNRTATIQFVGQEPTGGGELLIDSYAFGAASRVIVDLRAALADVEAHPTHGWHVQLNVHVEGSQGPDLKHKRFWVSDCAA